MHEYIIALLAFVTIISLGGAVLLAQGGEARPFGRRLRDVTGTQAAAPREAGPKRGLLHTLGRLGRTVSSGKSSAGLHDQLAKAGFRDSSAPAIYLGVKVSLLVVGTLIPVVLLAPAGLSAPARLSIPIAIGGGLFFLPNTVVRWRRAKRSQEVRHALPDAIDLLEVCLSSGMSLDAAWNLVGGQIRHVGTTLADEMALTNLEIHLGASREEAMRHMASRTDADELSSLVAVLVQSERFGTSMADALRTFATSLREERSFRAQEAGEKVAVKLLFPLVLFLFPAIFVVLAGPAAIALAKMMAFG